jgi:hypothetical protein
MKKMKGIYQDKHCGAVDYSIELIDLNDDKKSCNK